VYSPIDFTKTSSFCLPRLESYALATFTPLSDVPVTSFLFSPHYGLKTTSFLLAYPVKFLLYWIYIINLEVISMTNTMVHHVAVEYDPLLSVAEMTAIVEEEIAQWKDRHKELARVLLTIDGENVEIKAIEKSPVRRVRRITGYLSNMENFNDAKQDELHARFKHCCG